MINLALLVVLLLPAVAAADPAIERPIRVDRSPRAKGFSHRTQRRRWLLNERGGEVWVNERG
jgi:hypothetical protein